MKFANNSANTNGVAGELACYDGPCVFFSLHIRTGASGSFVMLFDTRSAPRTGDRPKRVWEIAELLSFDHETTNGIPMQNGCFIALSTTALTFTPHVALTGLIDVVFYIPPPPAPPKTDPLPEEPALKPSPAPQRPPPASTPAGRTAPTSRPLKGTVAALLACFLTCVSGWAASSTTPTPSGGYTKVAAGTNVTVQTNGLVYTVNAEPGVGGSATNAQPQSSILTNLATVGISTTNIVWVSKAGNDTTGARCRIDLPFATPSAAKLAALSGDTVFIPPGFFVATNSLSKSNVHWYVMAGATLAYTNQFVITNSGTARALFDDLDGAVHFKVDGHGDFIYDAGVPPFDDPTDSAVPSNLSIKGLLYIQNSNSVVSFKGRRAAVRSYATAPVLPSAFWINDGDVSITVEEIIDLGMGTTVEIGLDAFSDPVVVHANVSALYWALGETHFNAGTIRVSAYPVYAFHPTGSGHIANLWARMGYVTNVTGSAIYIYGSGSPAWKTWIDVFAIENNSTTAYSLDAGGSHYLKAMKLQSQRGLDLGFAEGGVTRGWFDIQKLSVTTSALNVTSTNALSHFDISVDHIDDLAGTLDPAMQFAGGAETWVRGGRVLLANGRCVLHRGGRAHVEGFTLDSSSSTNPAVMVRTNGLVLKDCTIVVTNTQFSIGTDLASTFTVHGYNSILITPATNRVAIIIGSQQWAVSGIASNATTAQADFTLTGIGDDTKSTDVMRANLALQLTNLVAGRALSFFFTGDTNANDRTVTVSTNGITGSTLVRWNLNSATNGATSFTVTNNTRVELSLKCLSASEVWAVWGAVR